MSLYGGSRQWLASLRGTAERPLCRAVGHRQCDAPRTSHKQRNGTIPVPFRCYPDKITEGPPPLLSLDMDHPPKVAKDLLIPGGASLQQVSTAAGTDLKVHALLRLKMSEYAKQVLGRRVALRSKHPHETVGGDECRLFQLPKADRGVDIVAQDRAARLLVAGEHEFDCFTKQRLAEFRFLLGAFADRFAKIFGQCHGVFPRSSCSGSLPNSPLPGGCLLAGASSCHPQPAQAPSLLSPQHER